MKLLEDSRHVLTPHPLGAKENFRHHDPRGLRFRTGGGSLGRSRSCRPSRGGMTVFSPLDSVIRLEGGGIGRLRNEPG